MTQSEKYYQIMDKSKKYLKDKVMLEAKISAEFSEYSLDRTEAWLCKDFDFGLSEISKLDTKKEIKRVRGKLVKAKSDIGKKITESLDTANLMLENYQKILEKGLFQDKIFPRYNKRDLKSGETPPWTYQTQKQFSEKIENDRELFLRNIFPPEKIYQLIENILTSKSESDINDKIYRFKIVNSLLQKCLGDLSDNLDITYKDFVKKDIDQIKALSSSMLWKIESGKK